MKFNKGCKDLPNGACIVLSIISALGLFTGYRMTFMSHTEFALCSMGQFICSGFLIAFICAAWHVIEDKEFALKSCNLDQRKQVVSCQCAKVAEQWR